MFLLFALLCCVQAVKRDPTNPAYRNNLAAALSKIGDFNAAKAACDKVRGVVLTYIGTSRYSKLVVL